MHFYKVPRLGSYLAIRLEYKSCLFEEALDSAVTDYLDVKQRIKDFENKTSSMAEAADDDAEDGGATHGGHSQHNTHRRMEDIKPKPFKTQTV